MADVVSKKAKQDDKENARDERLHRIRHSTAHIMAEAVLRMFPDAKIAIGPAIEHGFYYDFDLPRSLSNEDLEQIEDTMRSIVSEAHEFRREVVDREKAASLFQDQPYKLEILNDLPEGEEVSIYTVDKFTDLCRGPHVESTKEIHPKSFKLLNVAGAYWRGDEKRPMLQRIYGTAWETPKELREHLNWLARRSRSEIIVKLGTRAGSLQLRMKKREVG